MKKCFIVCLIAAAAAAVSASGLKGTLPEPLLIAGSGRVYVLGTDGSVLWEKKGCGNAHRVYLHDGWAYYSNENLFRARLTDGRTELFYKPCPKEAVYGFEVLPNGNIVVAENGTDYVTELKAGTTNALVRFAADPRKADGTVPNAHHHFRMIRKTPSGTYLVCCSGANFVREYDASGRLVWEQKVPALAFDALRRANGNTFVSHLGAVTEYTPDHKKVWSFACSDAPDLNLANLCGIQEMPNENLVIGTYANGRPDGSRVTAFEVTRDKKVVWSYASTDDRNMMTVFRIPSFSVK